MYELQNNVGMVGGGGSVGGEGVGRAQPFCMRLPSHMHRYQVS